LVQTFPRRQELQALVRYYRHLQNEHHRAAPQSAARRRIEEKLLDVRQRLDRILEEWVPDEDVREAWRNYLHNRAPEPDGPPEIRPLVFAGRSDVTGSVVEIRGKKGEELEVTIDGAPIERIDADEDFAITVPPARYRVNDNEYLEIFTASPEALQALAEFPGIDNQSPPWEYAAELLGDGLIDTNFALTPRGRRALATMGAVR
jgi:hypothetical protein